jgi:DNA-binding MarR family transcriptional regulator
MSTHPTELTERPAGAAGVEHRAELAVLLRTGYQRIVEQVHTRLARAGFDDVRPAHMTIFQHLRPEGSRIGELAERAQLTNQSVGYLVDYLEERGYVERRMDPTNRRATLVCLTDRGWEEMRACARILEELEAESARHLGPDRLRQLYELLVDLVGALPATK